MVVDTNLVLMALGTIIYAAYFFKKLAGLATISSFEMVILQAIFFLPMQLFGRLLGIEMLPFFLVHMAIGLILFPVFLPRLKYGVLSRQGFLRLVGLGKMQGIVIEDEAGLKNIDVLVVDPGEFDGVNDNSKSLPDPRFKSALKLGISIETAPEFLARNYGFIEIKHHITASQVKLKKARFFDIIKTWLEMTASLILLVFMSPVLGIIWCLIYWMHGSPVLFRQERLGKRGQSFEILKFRTMNDDGTNIRGLGEFLRQSHLDELPQLFNVLSGDMALIGPRPEWIYLTTPELAPTDYWIRRTIKPGISGWAQVNYRPSRSRYMREKKLGYDIYYINNRSIFLDSLIWVRTVASVLRLFMLPIQREKHRK